MSDQKTKMRPETKQNGMLNKMKEICCYDWIPDIFETQIPNSWMIPLIQSVRSIWIWCCYKLSFRVQLSNCYMKYRKIEIEIIYQTIRKVDSNVFLMCLNHYYNNRALFYHGFYLSFAEESNRIKRKVNWINHIESFWKRKRKKAK